MRRLKYVLINPKNSPFDSQKARNNPRVRSTSKAIIEATYKIKVFQLYSTELHLNLLLNPIYMAVTTKQPNLD